MTRTTEEYTVIAIYGGAEEGSEAISAIDGTPGYLHIHIIRKDILRKLPALEAADIQGEKSTIYQWGAPLDKDLAIRKPLVSVQDIIKYGNVGIGSAAIGGEEEKCTFVGGGEVFIIPSPEGVKAFRITKGQGVFPLKLDDHCWTCEVTNDSEAHVVPVEKQEIFNRAQLLEILQKAHGQNPDMPFVAQFDALFEKENLAVRSNGLWPDDEVGARDITLFDAAMEDPVGGHLLGNSNSEGDQLNKHKGIVPLGGAQVSLIPEGVVKIAPIQKRLIGLKSDPKQFRAPLLQRELAAVLQESETHKPILINGGGMAGVMTALKLARLRIPCTIVEQNETLLLGTSGRTPARVGHGYHYRDLDTAKLYLQSSIAFIKENCGNPEKKSRFTVGVSEEVRSLIKAYILSAKILRFRRKNY
ncbi:MAG: FAD-dependent oxidoreductase [Pseudomonadota bacterium]